MTQAYRMKTSSPLEPQATEGVIVFRGSGYDYGLAAEDTAITGIEHISVSLKRSGGSPTFTHPLRNLEPTTVEPLPKLTEDHVRAVCRPGAGAATCRYLTLSSHWQCEKHTSLAASIDWRQDKMVARGDNCEGLEPE